MQDESKTKEELISELRKLRTRVSRLEANGRLSLSVDLPYRLSPAADATQSIDLSKLFTRDVTDSGSFDVRGGIWASTFGKVMQALPIPALLVDQSCNVTVVNEALGRVCPDYENILDSPFSSLFPTPSAATKAQDLLERVFADRKPRIKETGLKIRGTKMWGRMTLRSVRILEKRFMLVLIEDLTAERRQLILNRKQRDLLKEEIAERRLSEKALRESETRFRQIYHHAPMMMQAISRGGLIQSVNSKWLTGMGYALNEVVANTIENIMSQESQKSLPRFLAKLWANREIHGVRSQYLKKDGTVLEALDDWVVMDVPIWGTVGLSTIRDITQEILLEKQLREAQKMEAVGTLASGIAHDFNNLLQIILSYADLLLMEGDKQGPAYERLRSIRETARRGADLVNQILTFSRKVETNPRLININHVVENTTKLLFRTIPKMIQTELQLDAHLKAVFIDPGQMEQILINLAINAKDAMPEGGKLIIGTRNVVLDERSCKTYLEVQPCDYVLLTVADTGHGMERDVRDRIFEPFFTTKRPEAGTGLGLATVFGIVKIHGGHITCHSHPGQGTSFEIYLPAMDLETGSDVALTDQMPAFGTETILLADDEELIRKVGKEVLTQAGYTVLTASDGSEALDLFKAERGNISLVILDLVMPKMGGKQCLEELLKIDAGMKVLVASGFPIDAQTREFLFKRVRSILRKPFKVKNLLRTVRSVLDA